jgi:hypothetical protein
VGFLVALVHALADPGHDRGCQIKSRVQHFFRDPFFPGVRQALIYSRLAVAHDGDGNTNQFFFSVSQ